MTNYDTDLMKLWNVLPNYVRHVIDGYMGNHNMMWKPLSNLALMIIENPAMQKIDKRFNSINDVIDMLRLRQHWHEEGAVEWYND